MLKVEASFFKRIFYEKINCVISQNVKTFNDVEN
jgi:hypothetical protein